MSADETTQAFAGEAENTRERISATIDELQERLNPRRIVGEAVGSVQQGGAELLNSGLGIAKSHPLALAATGLAMGIAVFGNSRLKRARVDMGDESGSYSDYDDDYRSTGRETTQRFALSRGSTSSAIGENPVVSIVVGLIAGVILGVVFPETERERQLLGLSGERIGAAARAAGRTAQQELATARDKVSDATNHAKGAVQSVIDAAKSELHG